jgi:hypothetical protein
VQKGWGVDVMRRWGMTAACILVLSSIVLAPAAAQTRNGNEQPVDPKDACSMISAPRVGAAFGRPVVIDATASVLGRSACSAHVGVDPSVAPGGTMVAFEDYPTLLSSFSNAADAYQDRHAIETLAANQLVDVNGVGTVAYYNKTLRTLSVQATKRFAFTVQWNPAGAAELSSHEFRQLKKVATGIVERARRTTRRHG